MRLPLGSRFARVTEVCLCGDFASIKTPWRDTHFSSVFHDFAQILRQHPNFR